MKPKPTASQMQAAIEDLLSAGSAPTDRVPPEWKTAEDWGKSMNLSKSRTREKIKVLIDSGAWEMNRFRIASGCRVYPVPHYRKKKAQ